MRKAKILYKNQEAGMLIQHDNGSFTFKYDNSWINDITKSAISLTLTKSQQEYYSDFLFPLFFVFGITRVHTSLMFKMLDFLPDYFQPFKY